MPMYYPQLLQPMDPIWLDYNRIVKLINSLTEHKALGPDDMPTVVLKSCSIVTPFLYKVCDATLTQHELPRDWLSANVFPVFKSGSRSRVENYSRISLTCISVKILEHAIYSNLVDHLPCKSFFHRSGMAFIWECIPRCR